MDQEAADREAERLQAAGTRATTSVDADVPFRERFVQMMCQCGIPLTRADKMREWVESECKKSLTSSKHLSQHIPKLLKKETDLQEMILKAVKYIGIIFDATPRQGDFFALIARYIVLDADKKRACAEQQLIHCAALSGSLNQYTQVGEVSGGLQARGMKNNQAVAAMQDGCYTNGASHAMMNRIAAASGEAERFIATCLSHCASNAGKFIVIVFHYHCFLENIPNWNVDR